MLPGESSGSSIIFLFLFLNEGAKRRASSPSLRRASSPSLRRLTAPL
jgi:hypothetical protein